jgi:hypothetical protein
LRDYERLDAPLDWRTVSKLVEVISPDLHHFDTLAPELRGMHIGATYVVFFHMGQLSLDCIWSVEAVARKPDTLISSLA